jgi:hypothetical protein
MNPIMRAFVPVLGVAALLLTMPQPAVGANCQLVKGTQDGRNKQRAIEKSRETLEQGVREVKARHGWKRVSVTPRALQAEPLWKMVRTSVPKDAYMRPDVQSARAYTVCWEGVFSPAVCTSGAMVCQE